MRKRILHAFDNPASAAKCEGAIGKVMLAMCSTEGHTPVIRTRAKSGASVIPINRDIRADEAGSYDGPNAAIMAMSEAILQAFGRPLQ